MASPLTRLTRPIASLYRSARTLRALAKVDALASRGLTVDRSRQMLGLARAMGIPEPRAEDIYMGALSHKARAQDIAAAYRALQGAAALRWLAPRTASLAGHLLDEVRATRRKAVQVRAATAEKVVQRAQGEADHINGLVRARSWPEVRQASLIRQIHIAHMDELSADLDILGRSYGGEF